MPAPKDPPRKISGPESDPPGVLFPKVGTAFQIQPSPFRVPSCIHHVPLALNYIWCPRVPRTSTSQVTCTVLG